jgi:hypothetical protein
MPRPRQLSAAFARMAALKATVDWVVNGVTQLGIVVAAPVGPPANPERAKITGDRSG